MKREMKERIEEVIMLAILLNYKVEQFDLLFEENIYLEKDNKKIHLCWNKKGKVLSFYIYINQFFYKRITVIEKNYDEVIEELKENL